MLPNIFWDLAGKQKIMAYVTFFFLWMFAGTLIFPSLSTLKPNFIFQVGSQAFIPAIFNTYPSPSPLHRWIQF